MARSVWLIALLLIGVAHAQEHPIPPGERCDVDSIRAINAPIPGQQGLDGDVFWRTYEFHVICGQYGDTLQQQNARMIWPGPYGPGGATADSALDARADEYGMGLRNMVRMRHCDLAGIKQDIKDLLCDQVDEAWPAFLRLCVNDDPPLTLGNVDGYWSQAWGPYYVRQDSLAPWIAHSRGFETVVEYVLFLIDNLPWVE